MEPRKRWRTKRYCPEGGMPGSAPQDSRGGFQRRGSSHPGWSQSGGQAERASHRDPQPTSIASPFRGGTTPGFERSAVEAQDGTATEEKAPPQSISCTGMWPLGLAQIGQGRPRAARGDQEAASAQVTFPGPRESARPLQLMGPGDHPMQRLALMMAVMMLGMPSVNGCNTSVDSGSPGVGSQAEMMFPPLHGSATAGKP
jgi:hypothetical protein